MKQVFSEQPTREIFQNLMKLSISIFFVLSVLRWNYHENLDADYRLPTQSPNRHREHHLEYRSIHSSVVVVRPS
jgi:hypothetical protein